MGFNPHKKAPWNGATDATVIALRAVNVTDTGNFSRAGSQKPVAFDVVNSDAAGMFVTHDNILVVLFRPPGQSPRMKPSGDVLRIALLLFAATFHALSVPTNTTVITPANKIKLFDGRSLAGWIFVSQDTNAPAVAIWSVTNGVITCQGKPSGYARTRQAYRDYQLHAEWRFPAGPGNSGVFLHISGADQVWPTCLEAQLLSGSAGEIRLNGGSHADNLATPDAKSFPRRRPSSEKPVGEWNSYDIVCRSNTVTVRVNGVLQNQVTGTSVSSGAIGLQAEGKPVEFRNLSIEPLP